jgi:hypothetical protein
MIVKAVLHDQIANAFGQNELILGAERDKHCSSLRLKVGEVPPVQVYLTVSGVLLLVFAHTTPIKHSRGRLCYILSQSGNVPGTD